MKTYQKLMLLFVVVIMAQSCKTVDLRTDYVLNKPETNEATRKGKALLQEAYEAMGYDKLLAADVYETTANFSWKKGFLLFPVNSLPGNNNKDLQFRFAVNNFDGQVKYLEGRKKNRVYGLQSWQGYYAKDTDADPVECNSRRYEWGLASYHYLLEAPMRLLNAEIIKYAGTREVNGITYDLVFATWGSEEPNKEFDQWLVYIHPETKFIDISELTVRDFFAPNPGSFQHGTVLYAERTKTSIGTYFPSEVIVQIGKPKKEEKGIYRFTLRDYKFDSFSKSELYPFEGLQGYGDAKPLDN